MGTWPARASDLAGEQELTDRDGTTGVTGQANLPKGSEEEGQTPVVEKARARAQSLADGNGVSGQGAPGTKGHSRVSPPRPPHLLTRPEPWACGRPLLVRHTHIWPSFLEILSWPLTLVTCLLRLFSLSVSCI